MFKVGDIVTVVESFNEITKRKYFVFGVIPATSFTGQKLILTDNKMSITFEEYQKAILDNVKQDIFEVKEGICLEDAKYCKLHLISTMKNRKENNNGSL